MSLHGSGPGPLDRGIGIIGVEQVFFGEEGLEKAKNASFDRGNLLAMADTLLGLGGVDLRDLGGDPEAVTHVVERQRVNDLTDPDGQRIAELILRGIAFGGQESAERFIAKQGGPVVERVGDWRDTVVGSFVKPPLNVRSESTVVEQPDGKGARFTRLAELQPEGGGTFPVHVEHSIWPRSGLIIQAAGLTGSDEDTYQRALEEVRESYYANRVPSI